jgi:hypothetical protein
MRGAIPPVPYTYSWGGAESNSGSCLACFPYFEKIKEAYEITFLCVCVCLCIPHIVARQRLRFLCGPCRIEGK